MDIQPLGKYLRRLYNYVSVGQKKPGENDEESYGCMIPGRINRWQNCIMPTLLLLLSYLLPSL
jgi:hypothetical protein